MPLAGGGRSVALAVAASSAAVACCVVGRNHACVGVRAGLFPFRLSARLSLARLESDLPPVGFGRLLLVRLDWCA